MLSVKKKPIVTALCLLLIVLPSTKNLSYRDPNRFFCARSAYRVTPNEQETHEAESISRQPEAKCREKTLEKSGREPAAPIAIRLANRKHPALSTQPNPQL